MPLITFGFIAMTLFIVSYSSLGIVFKQWQVLALKLIAVQEQEGGRIGMWLSVGHFSSICISVKDIDDDYIL